MALAGQQHELACSRDEPNHLARLWWQQLVAVAVEQQQRATVELVGLLAAGGLRGKRDDAFDGVLERARSSYRDRAAERVSHCDCVARATARREVDGRAHVDRAAVEVVRPAEPAPQRGQ